MRLRTLLIAIVLPLVLMAQGGGDLYDTGSVRELRIYFAEPDWRERLNALYLEGNDRLVADLWIDGTLLADVGVRFKGYSSYSPGQVKNPFNIELDHVVDGQDYQGFSKLKLSNVTSDPSFLREVLAYEVARNYMPASRAGFANVYVNDTLQGLYVSVEDVGKDFLERSFGSRENPFVKGNPPTVSLTGENSNLSNTPGTDSSAYYPFYELESEYGWRELLDLITVLNTEPDSVEQVLNVDRVLWMHAFNYAVINFDSYVGYAQNYYLYRDDHARWNPILWDLNMSFASFRLSDASLYWNGFNIAQAITMDPLMHLNSVSVVPRPLMRNLFQNAMYRRMYLAHLRTIINEQFASGAYRDRAVELQTLVAGHVQADTNKFFSDADFLANLDATVAGITDYPGITPLMDQRSAYLAMYPGFSGEPVIGTPMHAPVDITMGEELWITATVSGADTVFLAYRQGDHEPFIALAMLDDGAHGDGAAGDGLFGASFIPGSNMVHYYLYAENEVAGAFSPARAAHEFHSIVTRIAPNDLVINELMASNGGQTLNEAGEAADWIELYNPGEFTVSTAGLYLSDDLNDPMKWPLPAITVASHAHLMIWADERSELGDHHANFKLDAGGEALTLAYDADAVLDRVTFGPQYPIYSTARYPNGGGSFQELVPTFAAYNRLTTDAGLDRAVVLYPNPASTELNAVVRLSAPFELQVLRADGRAVSAQVERSTNDHVRIGIQGLAAGHYILSITSPEGSAHEPFIILP